MIIKLVVFILSILFYNIANADDLQLIETKNNDSLYEILNKIDFTSNKVINDGDVLRFLASKSNEKDLIEFKGENCVALHVACKLGKENLIKKLISNDVDIDVTGVVSWKDVGNKITETRSLCIGAPLHIAAKNGHQEIVKLLVREGANVNQLDANNRTPLSYAAQKNQVHVVQLLLEKEADHNYPDCGGRTPFYYALLNKYKLLGVISELKTLERIKDKIVYSCTEKIFESKGDRIEAIKNVNSILRLIHGKGEIYGYIDPKIYEPYMYSETMKNKDTDAIRGKREIVERKKELALELNAVFPYEEILFGWCQKMVPSSRVKKLFERIKERADLKKIRSGTIESFYCMFTVEELSLLIKYYSKQKCSKEKFNNILRKWPFFLMKTGRFYTSEVFKYARPVSENEK